jgi:uncharacterized protein (TIGR03437 family)
VRRVDARSGIITTVAGNGTVGDAGDGGPATSAQLYFPTGVALDDQNNLYISDLGNQRVRRVSNGLIANFAGTGERGFDGDGGPAEQAKLRDPYLLRLDLAGDLYIADSGNHRVRRVKLSNLNPDNGAGVGTITTVAGNGARGAGGDGGDPLTAQLNFPSGMAVDGSGDLYIADYGNHRIRKVALSSIAAGATIASAASFINGVIAPESIAIAVGQGLSSATVTADLLPPPTDLGGTTVTVRDSAGVSRLARLLFVSPDQINFEVPAGTSAGTATFIISSGYGRVSVGTAEVAHIAPGIYFVNSGGVGLASATILRLLPDGGVRYEPVVAFDAAQNGYALVPIDLSAPNEKVVLVLFATGLRFRSASAEVGVTIAGRAQEVLYASLQGYYRGLDQVNVMLDPNLAGSGEVEVVLTVEGKVANIVKIRLK